ncbi:MAG: adenylate/guanylate cyclase domain-containing protein [Sulfurimonas sp.]|uniref:CHASE2 domain-containing protein n=1 Tax=Sulfurimonas sp. TaxID=2022749 RepID=UPI0025DB8898|nr:adenylate/guanylate cyclase domain-containing protein [Sulfurimonas sp.]MCK9490887.1 adenylate/guanylate cyclase domain-containing protein [Sulfurimonas sp.]
MRGKYKALISLFILLSLILSSAYLFLPSHFQSLDDRVRDFYFKARGATTASEDIVIIDIDERSIKELGQWPWERDKVALILKNLALSGAGIIGLDIVFSEADKTSPKLLAQKWGFTEVEVPDYDLLLSQTIAATPTIAGYVFDFDANNSNEAPQIPAIFVERSKQDRAFILEASGVLPNLKIIQDASYSSGYLNNVPDEAGIIRSVPLMIRYQQRLYPSLAFEMYRIANQSNRVTTTYSEVGVESVEVGKTIIPTDRFARMHLNFRGPARSYRYISAVDIFHNSFDPKRVEGKFVLIGTSAYGLMDLRSTPLDSVIAGVEIHANMIDNLLRGDMLRRPVWAEVADLSAIIVVAFIVIFIYSRLSLLLFTLAIIGSSFVLIYLNYYLLFDKLYILNALFPLFSIFLSLIGVLGVNYFFESRLKEMIKTKFASKVSASVMEDILQHSDSDALEGQEKEITVFFSDIRGFTNISEAMGDAKKLIRFMNEIMEPMTEIIIDEKGTIDKYIGDAIMAYWNAPLDLDNHADRAMRASLRQLHHLKRLNEDLRADPDFINVSNMADEANIPIVDIGIGLNTGLAIVGEMGSKKRSDYTVIGDTINVGARLESLCKFYNSRLNISNFTKSQLKGNYIFRFLDLVTVKGKSEPVEIWQVHDFADEVSEPLFYSSKEDLLAELETYHRAIDLYKAENFKEALVIFEELNLLEFKSNLKICEIYIERCKHYVDNPPKEFNGVFVHTTKG